MKAPLLALGLLIALAGCDAAPSGAGGSDSSSVSSGTGSGGACMGPMAGDLPCDVGAVLAAKCQTCHGAPLAKGAHFPLLTYEDTQKILGTTSKLKWQRMAEVIELGATPHMPYTSAKYPDTPQLTDAELATLRSWFKACAPPVPEGSGCDVVP